ncbi:MAG: acyl-CoA synthetase [Anaerolineaceae bacterium 4572_78]|nr:MAG: acyl-CoA synthetase [Anaerolineaceae bacterium 4572_78]
MAGFRTYDDVIALEQTPLNERNLPSSTYEMLQRGATISPDGMALQFFLQGTDYTDAVKFSHQEFMEKVTQTANMLHDLGISKHDVVTIILPNLPETLFTIWGGEAAGIINPINPMLEPAQIAEIMNTVKTKVLVTLMPFPTTDIWEKVSSIVNDVPSLQSILQVDIADYLPTLKRTAVKALAWKTAHKSTRPKLPIRKFAKLIKRYPSDKLTSGREIMPDDIASYFHTGGTTGTPKIALHSHFNEVFDTWSTSQVVELDTESVVFNGLPLFHVHGVITSSSVPLSNGSCIVLGTPQGYRGEDVFKNFWKIVEHYKVTLFISVPTILTVLLRESSEEHDISSLKFAISGAAPMSVEVFQRFEERTGVHILEGYGLTEGTCIAAVNPVLGERRIGSVGFPIPYQEMKIAQLDADGKFERFCEVDEIGTIALRGPNVFKGYKEDVHNKIAWFDSGDEQGKWLNTGDMGRKDSDGYFWLTGRKKELIIRGGHNIEPKLIEGPLYTHPAVALVAAIGRPDPRVGELPIAYVQLKPGMEATEDELIEFAKEHIAERASIPKKIYIVDEVPLTNVGKIFKPSLSWREIKSVYEEALTDVAGVRNLTINVGSHKLHGTLANIQIECEDDADNTNVTEAVNEILGTYTINYEIEFVSS